MMMMMMMIIIIIIMGQCLGMLVVSLLTMNMDIPNLLIWEFYQNPDMEKMNNSQSISSLSDQRTGLEPRTKWG